jgi:hypothetical protein
VTLVPVAPGASAFPLKTRVVETSADAAEESVDWAFTVIADSAHTAVARNGTDPSLVAVATAKPPTANAGTAIRRNAATEPITINFLVTGFPFFTSRNS